MVQCRSKDPYEQQAATWINSKNQDITFNINTVQVSPFLMAN